MTVSLASLTPLYGRDADGNRLWNFFAPGALRFEPDKHFQPRMNADRCPIGGQKRALKLAWSGSVKSDGLHVRSPDNQTSHKRCQFYEDEWTSSD